MSLGSAPGIHEKPFISFRWKFPGCAYHTCLCLQYWLFGALSALSAARNTVFVVFASNSRTFWDTIGHVLMYAGSCSKNPIPQD